MRGQGSAFCRLLWACALAIGLHQTQAAPRTHAEGRRGAAAAFPPNARIGIVGAGPAGVHMAAMLKGVHTGPITILERTHRVGGKSFTLYKDLITAEPCDQVKDNTTGVVDYERCIAHEMGTCFLHNGYHVVRDLVNQYGLKQEMAPEGRAMWSAFSPDPYTSQTMSAFITSSVMAGVNDGSIKLDWWVPRSWETLVVMNALTDAVGRYNDLHLSIFGEVEFSMPDRITPDNLQRINMTFFEFLQSNDLDALVGFLQFAHAAQGYGYIKSIPALYGLWWVSPELLNGYIQQSMHQKIEELLHLRSDNFLIRQFVQKMVKVLVGGEAEDVYRTTTMLPQGYGQLWKAIYETEELNVRFGVSIRAIDRQLSDPSAPIRISYTQDGGSAVTAEFDFLMYTAPFANAGKYVTDLTDKEEMLFSSLSAYVLATSIYRGDALRSYTDNDRDAPIMYDTTKMEDRTFDGGWYADRTDPRIFGPESYIPQHNQTRVAYQFFEDPSAVDALFASTDRYPDVDGFEQTSTAVSAKLMSEFAARKQTGVTLVQQFAWPYFHHHGLEGIQRGVPWDLVDAQGQSKTWWLGASASFESVHDVCNYNLMMLNKFHGTNFVGDGARTRLMREAARARERDVDGARA